MLESKHQYKVRGTLDIAVDAPHKTEDIIEVTTEGVDVESKNISEQDSPRGEHTCLVECDVQLSIPVDVKNLEAAIFDKVEFRVTCGDTSHTKLGVHDCSVVS